MEKTDLDSPDVEGPERENEELQDFFKSSSAHTATPPSVEFSKPSLHSPGANSNEELDNIPTIPYRQLFRFADGYDYFLIILGSICGIAHGAGLPALFIIFGELTTSFTEYGRYQQCDLNYTLCLDEGLTILNQSQWESTVQPQLDSFERNSVEFVLYLIYVALGVFVLATLQTGCWTLQAVRQVNRIRSAYFRSILRQDIGFHDATSAGELNARLASDVSKIKDGMAEKMSTTIQYTSMAIAGIVVGLSYSWKVALVTLSISPLLIISTVLMLKVTGIFTKKELSAYAKAGSIAEEAISSIRTVVAFGCEQKEVERYESNLLKIKNVGVQKGFATGSSVGFLYLSLYAMYGLAFWYGTSLVLQQEITIGALTTTFFGILITAFSLGTAVSYSSSFSAAKGAGTKVFELIDRIPQIDIFSEDGQSPSTKESIEFKKVDFFYPTRKNMQVLKDVSLTIEHGKTTALVGQSGCGKSTCIQLIQRFYDCTSGDIFVGGKNIKDINVKKHRDQIGVVSQEPVLFATTIAENIRWGRDGVTDQEVHEAAKQANAYRFIMKLPRKFNTLVGEGGGQLSGGQKQRIAIARAIARNPKILLLDEATSALDTESESTVQAALDKASAGRTTVVIAHRLSTIRNADKIIAFHEGAVMEEGSHDELVSKQGGVYSNLVNMQAGWNEVEENETDFLDDIPECVSSDTNVFVEEPIKRRRFLSSSSRSKTQSSIKSRKSSIAFRRKSSVMSHRRSSMLSRRRSSALLRYTETFIRSTSEADEDVEEDLPNVGFRRIVEMNKPEWIYLSLGILFSAIAGGVDPFTAVLFADILEIFILSDPDEQLRRSTLYGLLFLALGFVSVIAYTVQATLFAKSGIELTVRLRKMAFGSILRQDISYFDDHRNSTGALCTRLSTDASRVQGCTGVQIGLMVKNLSAIGVALGISFAYGWQLTLLTIAFIPFLAIGGFLEFSLVSGQEEVEEEVDEEAGQVAGEAIKNIRTVASMTKEKKMYEIYLEKLQIPFRKTQRRALIMGLGYGYSQTVVYFAYAAVFRLGIYLVINRLMTFNNVFKVLTAVIFGAQAIGQNSSLAPDFAEAKTSAKRIFALLDKRPRIDCFSDEGASPAHCKGDVSLKKLYFTYPSRPDVPVLRGCTISVKPGQTLALVGQSGCGKSTSVQLIERFYDPDSGVVTLDGANIRELNVSWLRHQMGLVSQEPVLFNQSILDNIRYGDCQRTATMDEVIAAAKNANIHDFINSLPEGYETSAGAKGSKLSGGQKQRIAIARALLRNPRILLLDEATSALDTESEKIVQTALDAAREGRTCIVIAHRLSTVRNADQIAVIDNGVVAEVGTHDELIALGRDYYRLVKTQLSNQEKS